MESYLLSLPVELLIRILSKLDAVSLQCSTLTCKFIYDAIETSSQLQYTKELHLDGLKDAGTSAGYPTLIEELRRRRHSWYTSGLSLPLRIDTRGMDFIRPWELVGGLFASATSEWKIQISRLPTSTSMWHLKRVTRSSSSEA
ncbi:hypothetical protein BDN70DRAFT_882237 [Pholiota conissans]|uniref:F-box domain-containing protein n=1 Tax=Pholiota conissans TaxID=109636 RepID=A0A9P5YZ64_9AGAR|nr:hypothetical protein BDN70DRAFT_882237 [Pholiota conissans]